MKCVNAVDKGVAGEMYGNATNKGVAGERFCKLMKRRGLKIGICHGGTERTEDGLARAEKAEDNRQWRVASGERRS
jgi:hypothetical protein